MNKNVLFSIITSLVFPISLIIGEILGLIIAEIVYFIYRNIMFLNLSDWFSEISIRAIQGIIAGFIAGYVTVFLYKDFHFKSSLILPMILLSMAILGALFMMLQEGDYFNRFTDIVSLVASGYIYISYLDENKKISSQTED